MNDIGSRIAIIVKKNGGKNVAFAERLNIDPSYVTQLINGKRSPSERLILTICREFDIQREWLETGKGKMRAQSRCNTLDKVAKRYSDSPTFRAMLDVYAELDADGQEAVERYIARLSKALEEGRDPAATDDFTDQINQVVETGKLNCADR